MFLFFANLPIDKRRVLGVSWTVAQVPSLYGMVLDSEWKQDEAQNQASVIVSVG